MVEAPVLAHPDFTQPFVLDTDASDMAIGAVLSQKINGQEHVIAYASRTLTKSEKRYCVTRKELLALVHFVKYFRHYLYGKAFTVRTHHSSLKQLMRFKNPEGQLSRWLEILSYSMKIEHRPGRLHGNADGVSRIPCRQCGRSKEDDNESNHLVISQLYSIDTATEAKEISEEKNEDPDICQVKSWLAAETRPVYRYICIRI